MEGQPIPIENEDKPALRALVKEVDPSADEQVISATVKFLQLREQETPGFLAGQQDVVDALARAKEARADIPTPQVVMDSNRNVMGEKGSVDTQGEREA